MSENRPNNKLAHQPGQPLPVRAPSQNIVLYHDWLTTFRGGERVLEALCEVYPKVPLYTLLHKKGSVPPLIENRTIHTSVLDRVPGIYQKYRSFLPLFPTAVDLMRVKEKAEVVLSISHCVIKGIKKPEGSVHVSYINSPMRYMYDQYDNYFGPHASRMVRLGGRVFRPYLVKWDLASNANVDLMVANSSFVRERIRKFYQLDAEVVHPFVDLQDFNCVQDNPPMKDENFVVLSAFAPNKRVDLAIEAFNRLKLPLTVIGDGQMAEELKRMAGPTITFLSGVDRKSVIQHLAKARALIFPGVEDFGIVPLEALAAGTPVIAFRAGGVLETLTDEDTVFFDDPTPESLITAIEIFNREGRKPDRSRLQKWSRERYQREMLEMIELAKSSRRN
jgi:glycosyltransferase involved in cell wall biosynthesis